MFPARLDEQSGDVVFVPTTRTLISRVSSLGGRESFASQTPEARMSYQELADLKKDGSLGGTDWNFIFHTGFCCSTLLARCLDRPGACLALKEPGILNALSHVHPFVHSKAPQRIHREKLSLCLELLFRRPETGDRVIVKPSSDTLVLLDEIVALNPGSRMVFLYSDLKSFVLSVAKGGRQRHDRVRQLLVHLLADFKTRNDYDPLYFGMRESRLWTLPDLHIAAAAWRLQMKYLVGASPDKSLWVNCQDLLGDPETTLGSLFHYFGIGAKQAAQSGPPLEDVLNRYAGAPAFRFNAGNREIELSALEKHLAGPLEEALSWAENITGPAGRPAKAKVAV